MDMSNKSLAILLGVAIVVSLGSTIVSLNKLNQVGFTGFAASDTGLTNLSIDTDITITFTQALVNFGTGYVNDSGGTTEVCQLVTNVSWGPFGGPDGDCVGFNTTINNSNGFRIRNDGNQDVNLNISSNVNVSTFVTGSPTLAQFNWSVKNAESGACSAGGPTPANFTNVTTAQTTACTNFNYEDSSDLLTMDLLVQIPQNALPGVRQATITAIGFQ